MERKTGCVLVALLVPLLTTVSVAATCASSDPSRAADVRQIQTAERPAPGIRFVTGHFDLYVSADLLLVAMNDPARWAVVPDDMAESLQRLLPLDRDLSADELVEDLVERYRRHPDKSVRESVVRRKALHELRFALATLLHDGRVAVVDKRTGAPVSFIQERVSKNCGREQAFLTLSGEPILQVTLSIV